MVAAATQGYCRVPRLNALKTVRLKGWCCSTPCRSARKNSDKITVLPISPVFSEAIERIYEDKPVSIMFV